MELVILKRSIPLKEFESMTELDIRRYARVFSGHVVDIVKEDDHVVLTIKAPSTWRYLLLNSILLPYRYI